MTRCNYIITEERSRNLLVAKAQIKFECYGKYIKNKTLKLLLLVHITFILLIYPRVQSLKL